MAKNKKAVPDLIGVAKNHLSENMTLSVRKRDLFENIEHLKSLIDSENIDKEEISEFIETIRDQASDLQNSLEDSEAELEKIKDDLKLLKEEQEELKTEFDELEDSTDLIEEINTMNGKEGIKWSTDSIIDEIVMETLTDAYDRLSPAQIIECLKTGMELLY